MTPQRIVPLLQQGVGAVVLSALLVVFLVFLRVLSSERVPDQTIRLVETAPEIAAPPPPPPPVEEIREEPPPPPSAPLPQLEVELDSSAPALKATFDPRLDLTMQMASFDLEVDPPKQIAPAPSPRPQPSTPTKPRMTPPAPQPVKSVYASGELDAVPRLRNHPSVSYPRELEREGIKEGRVVLEVIISTNGSVSVKRVLSSNHPQFSQLARSIAGRSRFTIPTKNGKPVSAIYRWPIVLRP